VAALCGFVFGVACRLPPSLTLLILNGCFCFPIGYHLIVGKLRSLHPHTRNGYQEVAEENAGQTPNKCIARLLTFLEIVGFLVQLGVVAAAIPALLPREPAIDNVALIAIMIPLSLILISVVWSGWIQLRVSTSSVSTDRPGTARLKAGMYTC